MTSSHGLPCWFELATTEVAAAGDFYSALLGWTVADSGMPGMVYHLASTTAGSVAGIGDLANHPAGTPSHWLSYLATDDLPTSCERITAAAGSVLVEPTEIPGTGTFAIALDPQGAAIGLLQPLPPSGPMVGAFDQAHLGHAGWLELMTPEPEAALAFYQDVFGWTPGMRLDLGEKGPYLIFDRDGAGIGGMMGLSGSPLPVWLPYFTVSDVTAAAAHTTSAGGEVCHGPAPVPGGQQIAVLTDPQGAIFAVVSAV